MLLYWRACASVSAGSAYLLDLYPGVAAAYSLRVLSSLFASAAVVRVRRSFDNSEADFTAAEITDGTLTTWTGAWDGFVVTSNDQSGDAVDGSQSVAGEQAKIVSGGILQTGIVFDGINDNYDFTLSSAITGTVFVATTQGILVTDTTLEAGSYQFSAKGVSTNHARKDMNELVCMLLYDRTLSASEITTVKADLVAKFGAVDSFSSVTNFTYAWRGSQFTGTFPLLDSSNVTTFNAAWYFSQFTGTFPLLDSSNVTTFNFSWTNSQFTGDFPLLDSSNVTSFNHAWQGSQFTGTFPLLDSSNVTTFFSAWRDSRFTTFPANFFDSWTATPAKGCFQGAWRGMTNLTATSVENILNSIDTSGQSAPADAVDITIGYNTGTGTPNVATAITNLKARGWTITLNGVLQ